MRPAGMRLAVSLALLALAGTVLLASGAAATRSTLPTFVTVSPDGTRIAWSDGFDWQVSVADADGSAEHAIGAPFADGIGQLTWTHLGLIADSNYTLTLLTQAGKRIRIGVVGDQQFSVGGAHAASGSAGCGYCHGTVSVYNIRTHTVFRLGDPKKSNGDVALSPDGVRAAYYGPHGLVVQPAAGGPARRVRTTGSCNISWSPDGRTLALGSTGVSTVPAAGGRTDVLVPPSRGYACVGGYVPAWSPDASEILFGRLSGGSGSTQPIGQLAVVDVRTHTMRQTAKQLGTLSSYAWSPDGKSIFASFRTGDCGTIWHLDEATLTGDAVYRGCA